VIVVSHELQERFVVAQATRIGVFGGSFDPIHFGHLAIAEEARLELALDQVIFVPAAHQPLKGRAPSPAEQRLAMLRLACADNPAFRVDDLELRRPPPSYTSETLSSLHARLGAGVELWFILGADAAGELPRWHHITAMLELARLAIIARPGHAFDLVALQARLPALNARATLLAGPRLDISSSDLRQRLATGRSVRYQLPEPVRSFILQHQLYQRDEEQL
jgi:nicotinate-nucleotide adenylyltransferase